MFTSPFYLSKKKLIIKSFQLCRKQIFCALDHWIAFLQQYFQIGSELLLDLQRFCVLRQQRDILLSLCSIALERVGYYSHVHAVS